MLPNQQQSQEPRGEAAAASKEEKVQEEAKPKAQAKGKDLEAQDDQKTDDEVEQPSFGRPQNFQPHGSSGDLKKEVEVHNNLTVAVEVNAGTGWKALYPEGRVRFETPSALDVATRLRENHDISGSCSVEGVAPARVRGFCSLFPHSKGVN